MMTKCPTHKKSFLTREQAVQALLDARIRYEYGNGKGPVSIYQCEDCSNFHLTSNGTINETLKKQITEGKIDLQKEADKWLNKLKHR